MNTNFNLLNMLEGEVNIDHNKVKTWRFLDNSGKPEYFSKEELEIVFSSYLEEMENIIEDMK